MSKLDQFKSRASAHGQDITIYPFLAYPSGAYVDSYSGYPDPESPDYPGSIPEPSYDTPVTVKGFLQPSRTGEEGEEYIRAPWGEEVQVALVAYIPGDQAVAHRDKVVANSTNYWVAGIEEHREGATVVQRTVRLTESVPVAS